MNPDQENPKDSLNNPPSESLKPTVKITDALKESAPLEAEEKLSTIRTFQSDIAGAVKNDNVSMIKIALAEKEKREQNSQYIEIEEKKKMSTAYIVAGAISIVVLCAVGGVYWYVNKPAGPTLEQIIAPQEPEIVYTETQVAVSIDNKTANILLEDLRNEALKKLDLGTMKRIMVTTNTGSSTKNLNSKEFLSVIKSRANDSFKGAIEPYFVMGAYSFEPHDVFIVFKVNSYDVAYPSMLAWEEHLEVDLSNLFIDQTKTPPVQQVAELATTTNTAATNTASSTSGESTSTPITTPLVTEKPKPIKAVWKDRIIQNKDTRVLLDSEGKIKFLYSFIDKNTLIIVSSEKGFKELITRMTIGRISR